MSSIQLVDGRDVARDRALLKATKQRVKDEIAKRTAARVGKYLACPSNTVVDLHPDSDPLKLCEVILKHYLGYARIDTATLSLSIVSLL